MADASCPWKGLAPYGDRDGDTFFGRDADIAGVPGPAGGVAARSS